MGEFKKEKNQHYPERKTTFANRKENRKRISFCAALFLLCFTALLICCGHSTVSLAEDISTDSRNKAGSSRRTVKADCGTWIISGSKKTFRGTDQKLVKASWKKINHKMYYFNRKGIMQTGWLTLGGKKYYLSAKGILQTGFLRIGSVWYYANTKSGRIKTGWAKINGKTYYFKKSGIMQTGWTALKGKRYYFYRSGVMAVGTVSIRNKTYVFHSDGTLNQAASGSAIDPAKKMVALTFDDGPGQYTMDLLEVLEKYKARATFFLVGENVSYYNRTVKKMDAIGCEIGNHTMNHTRLTTLSSSLIYAQMNSTNDKIRAITGHNPTVMRPPYGSYNSAVLNAVGLPAIFWSIDTMDWSTLSTYRTVAHVKQNVRDGSIILMHDIYAASVDAAIQLIPWLQQQGYQLVTVSEMARIRTGGLLTGSIYAHMYP